MSKTQLEHKLKRIENAIRMMIDAAQGHDAADGPVALAYRKGVQSTLATIFDAAAYPQTSGAAQQLRAGVWPSPHPSQAIAADQLSLL